MKKKKMMMCAVFLVMLPIGLPSSAAGPSPVVSASWLQANLNSPNLLVLDIRKVEEYREGHIPGSLNLTYGAWRTVDQGLDCQLLKKDDLQDHVCSMGIRGDSRVIIVGKSDTAWDRVNTTRVAWTLKYAGVKNPAILDGGYGSWVNQNYPVTSGWEKRERSYHKCELNESVLATKAQVMASLNKAAIVDTRPAALFSGKATQPPLQRRGHIPGAVNLPHTLVFQKDGTFESLEKLGALASKAVGDNRDRQIIVLCCNGQFASSWWFVLSEMLGYRDVKIYDGSMEEWCNDEKAPLTQSDGRG